MTPLIGLMFLAMSIVLNFGNDDACYTASGTTDGRYRMVTIIKCGKCTCTTFAC